MQRKAPLLIIVCLCCAVSYAQTTIHVPGDQPTIQAGINAAHNGDTVLVAPGTYHEHLDYSRKRITVTSESGPSVTVIDGSVGAGAVVALIGKRDEWGGAARLYA